jgi:hypothetical protein
MDADAIAAVAAAKHDLSLSSASLQQSTAEFPPAVSVAEPHPFYAKWTGFANTACVELRQTQTVCISNVAG